MMWRCGRIFFVAEAACACCCAVKSLAAASAITMMVHQQQQLNPTGLTDFNESRRLRPRAAAATAAAVPLFQLHPGVAEIGRGRIWRKRKQLRKCRSAATDVARMRGGQPAKVAQRVRRGTSVAPAVGAPRNRWLAAPWVLRAAAADNEAPPSEGAELATRGGGQYRLMLVDDEEPLLKAVSEYLQQRGYLVTAYDSAQGGLFHLKEAVKGNEGYAWPDLIITDVNMPVMDGYQFLAALRMAGGRVGAIPVVFLTARGLTQDRIQGYRAGVNAYLAKPFDPEELVSMVDSVLLNTMNAAEVAATEAATTAYARAASSGQIRQVDGDSHADGDPQPVVELGENGDILGDVRRELGDIKALLLAERAQRRQLNGATISNWKPGNTNIGPPKLLGSATDQSSTNSSGSGEDSAASVERSAEDKEKLPQRPMLTPREAQVLELVTEGHTNREIASMVGLGVRSVERHVSKLLSKTGTSNRTELVRLNLQTNMTNLQ